MNASRLCTTGLALLQLSGITSWLLQTGDHQFRTGLLLTVAAFQPLVGLGLKQQTMVTCGNLSVCKRE